MRPSPTPARRSRPTRPPPIIPTRPPRKPFQLLLQPPPPLPPAPAMRGFPPQAPQSQSVARNEVVLQEEDENIEDNQAAGFVEKDKSVDDEKEEEAQDNLGKSGDIVDEEEEAEMEREEHDDERKKYEEVKRMIMMGVWPAASGPCLTPDHSEDEETEEEAVNLEEREARNLDE